MSWNVNAKWEQKMKVTDVSNFLHQFDVVMISEPWIHPQSLHLADLPGYNLLSCLRPNERLPSGGILMYIKSNLPHNILHHQPLSVEHIIVIQIGNVAITGAYLPPTSSRSLQHWTEDPMSLALAHLVTHGGILLGDLNAHAGVGPCGSMCPRGRNLTDLCSALNFRILPLNSFTFLRSDGYRSTLDHIVISDTLPAYNSQCHPDLLDWSDHAPISVEITTPGQRKPETTLPYRSIREAALASSGNTLPTGPALEIQQLESTVLARVVRQRTTKTPGFKPPTLTSSTSSNKRRLAEIMKSNTTDPFLVEEAVSLRKDIFRTRKARSIRSLHQYRESVMSIQSRPEFWRHIARFANTKDRQIIKVNSDAMVAHFAQLFEHLQTNDLPITPLNSQLPRPTPTQKAAAHDLLATPFTATELSTALSLLKDSCPGEDRLSLAELRTIPEGDILHLFSEINRLGVVPEAWKQVIVVPIPKPRADPSLPTNLRGISLQPTLKKVYSIIVNQRIVQWAETTGILPKTQNGFRPGRVTSNNAFVVRILHESAVRLDKRLFLVSLDLAKAYDSVNREKLFLLLRAWGLQGQIFNVLNELYSDTFASIRRDGFFSDVFPQDMGVAQGDPLSCILFIIYIALIDLADPDDMSLDGNPIDCLWLVDDLYIISTTEKGCQRKINSALTQATELDLRVNFSKCEFMGLGTVQLTDVLPPLHVGQHLLRRVWNMRVNGVVIDTQSSLNREGNTWPSWITASRTATTRQLAAAGRVSALIIANQRSAGLYTPNQLFQIYRSLIRSHFVYGTETIVDCGEKTERELNAFEVRCLRSAVSVSNTASPEILRFEFALPKLTHFRILLTMRYVVYLLSSDLDQPACWAYRQALSNIEDPRARRPQSLWLNRLVKTINAVNLIPPIDRTQLNSRQYWTQMVSLWEKNMRNDVVSNAILKFDSPRLSGIRPYLNFSFQQHVSPQHYLMYAKDLARAMIVLRTSTHHLAIESFRYRQPVPPREERLCPSCGVTEDEYHMVNKCPLTDDLRHELLMELNWSDTPRDWLKWCVNPPVTGGRKFSRFLLKIWEKIDKRNMELRIQEDGH